MYKPIELLPIGSILKAHGMKGEVLVQIITGQHKDFKEGQPVFIYINGLPVPFFIKDFDVIDDQTAYIMFEEVGSENAARKLIGNKIAIEQPKSKQKKKETIGPESFIGFEVFDQEMITIGTVKDFLDYTGNPLIEIKCGKRSFPVPYHEDFILKVDYRKRALFIKLPEGYTDNF